MTSDSQKGKVPKQTLEAISFVLVNEIHEGITAALEGHKEKEALAEELEEPIPMRIEEATAPHIKVR